jgi:hypothetical protein
MPMYDDGMHGDGSTGDGIFGKSFLLSAPQAHYYIYAENSTAGIFSPEKAEHEFYKVYGNIQTADSGKIAINEFLAVNVNGQQNEYLKNEDWIELYNKTSAPVDLYGLYLSDDASNPTKFAFPENSVIPANGFLTVWADESATGPGAIHCNFKLSSNGENIYLSNQAGQFLDSLGFGPQQTDISFGRCPDGVGNFIAFTSPSYNSQNCVVGLDEVAHYNFNIFPNPTKTNFYINSKNGEYIHEVKIYDNTGKLIYNETEINNTKTIVDINQLCNGIYFIRVNNSTSIKLIVLR